mmetsp:Transcript_18717/g.53773  ORF Transcript_18717/g.53773 Transcript_18717/m.53773 type:complete len:89 (+) Transcript_18717:226-492(+)
MLNRARRTTWIAYQRARIQTMMWKRGGVTPLTLAFRTLSMACHSAATSLSSHQRRTTLNHCNHHRQQQPQQQQQQQQRRRRRRRRQQH